MGITKTAFTEKAIQIFLDGDRKIQPELLITEKTNPNYISRDVLANARIREDHYEAVVEIANEYHCSYAIILYQALKNFCDML